MRKVVVILSALLLFVFSCSDTAKGVPGGSGGTTPVPVSIDNLKNVSVESAVNGIQINWDVSFVVEELYIYKSTTLDGSYTYLNKAPFSSGLYTDTAVEVGQSYYYKFTCFTAEGGESEMSAVFTAQYTMPGVSRFWAEKTSSSVILKWDGLAAADSYELHSSPSIDGVYTLVTTVSATEYPVPGPRETDVFYKIRAKKGTVVSAFSTAVNGSLDPLLYPDVTYTPQYDNIMASWRAVESAASYIIYQTARYTGAASLNVLAEGITGTEYKIPASSKTYYYSVAAVRADGSIGTTSPVTEVELLTIPLVNNIKTKLQADNASIEISWDPIAIPGIKYKVSWSQYESGIYPETVDALSTTSYTRSLIPAGDLKYYSVIGYLENINSYGFGHPRGVDGFTIQEPTSISCSKVNTGVQLHWFAPNTAREFIDAEITRTNASDPADVKSWTFPSIQMTFIDTSILKGVEYTYSLAFTYDGVASSSASNTFTYDSKVANLTASRFDFLDRIELNWDPEVDTTEYIVYRSFQDVGPFEEIGRTATTSYADMLPPQSLYYYQVKAVSSAGLISADSDQPRGWTWGNEEVRIGAQRLNDAAQGYYFDISWDAVPHADSYNLEVWIDADNDYMVHSSELFPIEDAPGVSTVFTGLSGQYDPPAGTFSNYYYFRVIPIREGVTGRPSNTNVPITHDAD